MSPKWFKIRGVLISAGSSKVSFSQKKCVLDGNPFLNLSNTFGLLNNWTIVCPLLHLKTIEMREP